MSSSGELTTEMSFSFSINDKNYGFINKGARLRESLTAAKRLQNFFCKPIVTAA